MVRKAFTGSYTNASPLHSISMLAILIILSMLQIMNLTELTSYGDHATSCSFSLFLRQGSGAKCLQPPNLPLVPSVSYAIKMSLASYIHQFYMWSGFKGKSWTRCSSRIWRMFAGSMLSGRGRPPQRRFSMRSSSRWVMARKLAFENTWPCCTGPILSTVPYISSNHLGFNALQTFGLSCLADQIRKDTAIWVPTSAIRLCSRLSYYERSFFLFYLGHSDLISPLQNTFSVSLSEEQLSIVLTTLVYDGVLENAPSIDDEETWQMKKWKIPYQTPYTSYPCGVCPVSLLAIGYVSAHILFLYIARIARMSFKLLLACLNCLVCPLWYFLSALRSLQLVVELYFNLQVINDCTPGGLISPETCVYFDKFLQF